MLVQGQQSRRAHTQMIEQAPGVTRIFRCDDINIMEYLGGADRNIPEMTDRRCNHIKGARLQGVG